MNGDELVITGLGVAAAGIYGEAELWAHLQKDEAEGVSGSERFSMRGFRADPYLKDRRQLKSVSAVDAIGLAALSGLVDASGYVPGHYQSDRVGLYVGAPGPAAADNDGYMPALAAARTSSGVSLKEFGKTSVSARPVTLLLGLANNVLCYGAMLLDARGANSNYTASALSAHLALIGAARRLQRGSLDLAVAGGFSGATDPVYTAMLRHHGLVLEDGVKGGELFNGATPSGAVLADGAAFVALERRSGAVARGAKIMASYHGAGFTSDGLGPLKIDASSAALSRAIANALASAGLSAEDVGLIFSAASGIHELDGAEFRALFQIFAHCGEAPALACTSQAFGQLMEAGGILELGLLPRLFLEGEVPSALRPTAAVAPFGRRLPLGKPYALILRTSAWGEYSCIVVRREEP